MKGSGVALFLAVMLALPLTARSQSAVSGDAWPEAQGFDGTCGVEPYRTDLRVPALKPVERLNEDNRRLGESLERGSRRRLLEAARLLRRVQEGVADVVTATNECSSWDSFDAFKSAAQAAADEEETQALGGLTYAAFRFDWTSERLDALDKQLKDEPLRLGEDAQVCRAPGLDLDIFAPDARPGDADPALAGQLAQVGAGAERVANSLQAQKGAFEGLLALAQGRHCRELADTFAKLARREKNAYLEYRQLAFARIVRGHVKWRRVEAARPAK